MEGQRRRWPGRRPVLRHGRRLGSTATAIGGGPEAFGDQPLHLHSGRVTRCVCINRGPFSRDVWSSRSCRWPTDRYSIETAWGLRTAGRSSPVKPSGPAGSSGPTRDGRGQMIEPMPGYERPKKKWMTKPTSPSTKRAAAKPLLPAPRLALDIPTVPKTMTGSNLLEGSA